MTFERKPNAFGRSEGDVYQYILNLLRPSLDTLIFKVKKQAVVRQCYGV